MTNINQTIRLFVTASINLININFSTTQFDRLLQQSQPFPSITILIHVMSYILQHNPRTLRTLHKAEQKDCILHSIAFFFLLWRCDPTRVMASSFLRFLDHTQRRTTVGRTPVDEQSAPRRDLYLTAHNNHNRQTSMPPTGFEPTISAGDRPQTYALDRAATGTGILHTILHILCYENY